MNKAFIIISTASVLTYCIPTIPVNAISKNNIQTVSDDNQLKTAGLLSACYLNISSGSKTTYINGSTQAKSTMKTIGYKDISVQYSSDGVNWHTEKNIDDLLKSDSNSYYLNNYSISVNGGYYYRITCTHYAKESGLFGSSQSIDNTSNSVWIN